MKKVSIAEQRTTLYGVWEWIRRTKRSYSLELAQVRSSLVSGTAVDADYVGMTVGDLEGEFASRGGELDEAGAFFIVAEAEALLRTDFLRRVYRREKDDLSRRFRAMHREASTRVRLEDHILAAWRDEVPSARAEIGEFAGLTNYRNWLAHGRYWVKKHGRNYDADSSLEIVENLFSALPSRDGWRL